MGLLCDCEIFESPFEALMHIPCLDRIKELHLPFEHGGEVVSPVEGLLAELTGGSIREFQISLVNFPVEGLPVQLTEDLTSRADAS